MAGSFYVPNFWFPVLNALSAAYRLMALCPELHVEHVAGDKVAWRNYLGRTVTLNFIIFFKETYHESSCLLAELTILLYGFEKHRRRQFSFEWDFVRRQKFLLIHKGTEICSLIIVWTYPWFFFHFYILTPYYVVKNALELIVCWQHI